MEDTVRPAEVAFPWDRLFPSLWARLRDLAADRSSPAEEDSSGSAGALDRNSCHRTVPRILGRIRSHHNRHHNRSHSHPGTDRIVVEAGHCTAVGPPGLQDLEGIAASAGAQVWQQQDLHTAVLALHSPRCTPLYRRSSRRRGVSRELEGFGERE